MTKVFGEEAQPFAYPRVIGYDLVGGSSLAALSVSLPPHLCLPLNTVMDPGVRNTL